MKSIYENVEIFIIGAVLYSGMEILFRGFTHWTMFLAGGLCITILYHIFARKKDIALWKKCLIGTLVITIIEFSFGCVVNLLLHWNVWDYSHFRFNLLGQVCLLYTALWFILSAPLAWFAKLLQKMTHSKLRL